MAVDSDRITPILIAPKRKQNCYDHRLRDAVFHLGQATTARYLDIPRSTIHGWKKARTKPVVTLVSPNSYVEDSLKERTNKSYSARSIMQADSCDYLDCFNGSGSLQTAYRASPLRRSRGTGFQGCTGRVLCLAFGVPFPRKKTITHGNPGWIVF